MDGSSDDSMKKIEIPKNSSPTNEIHGVRTVTGIFKDSENRVVSKFEHPPGKEVPVPDHVRSVEILESRKKLEEVKIASIYRG